MSAEVVLPGVLAELAGGARKLRVDGGTVGAVLDAIAADYPVLARRLRDETGAIRRFVNVYVDGNDVRGEQGLATAVRDQAVVHVLPSVAGG